MIPYIGDFVVNSTVRYYYGSNASSGASSARTTAGTYRVYKNISTTERTSSAGITDYSSFDTLTGLNAVTIDLSNNTDAGFYAAGNDYVVVLVGAVVDTQTINQPLFQFSIENRKNIIGSAVWDDLYASHSTAGTFGKLMDTLRKANFVINGLVVSGAGQTESTFRTDLTAYLTGTFDHQTVLFITGTLAGQSVPIMTFTQTNGVIVVEEPYTATPQPGDEFIILPQHVHAVVDVADGILSRQLDSAGSSNDVMNERTVRSALRAMRNKVIVNSGTMSVYKEDDVTAAWEGTLSNTANVTVNPDGGLD